MTKSNTTQVTMLGNKITSATIEWWGTEITGFEDVQIDPGYEILSSQEVDEEQHQNVQAELNSAVWTSQVR